jgi:hypothetical protein
MSLTEKQKDALVEYFSTQKLSKDAVIGTWITIIQDKMPAEIRNSNRWKSLLVDACSTNQGDVGQFIYCATYCR